jgi:type IV pilus assembly protein PilE
MPPRRPAGFTLVELCIGLALAGLLVMLAWPSLREPLLRSRRADAVAALTRIQLAQEQYRGLHGRYADRLEGLRGTTGSRSAEGLYELELHADGARRYEALARPRAGSAVAGDARCPVLRLQVDDGRARLAPDNRCWNR